MADDRPRRTSFPRRTAVLSARRRRSSSFGRTQGRGRDELGGTSAGPSGLCLFGAATDTWNLGVSALALSTVLATHRARAEAPITIFDNGFGSRATALRIGEDTVDVSLLGARHSRRLHRGDTLLTIRAAGALGSRRNAVIRCIRASDAVLDLSGGDSFTDLYGRARFQQVLLHKRIALSQSRPLLLLPQTYGPFRSRTSARAARAVLVGAAEAWARDRPSYERMAELLGPDFDPARHRLGVDVAFALPAATTIPPLPTPLASWLGPDRGRPVIGLNVSGLLFLDEASQERFGHRSSYRAVVAALLRQLLERTEARVVLLPHVLAPPGHPQSDLEASLALLAGLDDGHRPRVCVAPRPAGACEAKALISHLDWFCATRMHAAIAALSSGTPCSGIAYSVKTQGVFATCGQEAHVADLETQPADEVCARVLWSFERRDEVRHLLAEQAPLVREAAARQLGEALARVAPLRSAPGVASGRQT
ncbi:MAG: hypothetical protein GEV08_13090 [Acidimicrobiia bacterium]|nr:hypothetical protein [Acidimicrobiia bacterium]